MVSSSGCYNKTVKSLSFFTSPFLAFSLAFCLLFSFGLHSIQVEHTHFHAGKHHDSDSHSTMGEYLHLSDKKLLALPIILFVYVFFTTRDAWGTFNGILFSMYIRYRKCYVPSFRIFHYLCFFLRAGKIHSKAY
jgi:hypothetical protein